VKQKDLVVNLEELEREVVFDLIPGNPSLFKKSDWVRIIAEVKNTPEVFISIYEFNSENYYWKTMEPFKTSVDLEGLISQHQMKVQFENGNRLKKPHIFEFPQLDNRIGLFVIDFVASGFSSRAVVKKGSLTLI